jgi:MFS family permease
MRRWSLVCLLAVGVIIAYVDRTNLSIALAAKEFKEFFHLTDSQRGLLNSAFFWSYTLMQIPAGFLVDRFGVRIPLALGLLGWCAVSAATSMAGALWQLVALRLTLGVAEATLFPGGLSWIHRNVEEQRRGLAVGLFVSGTKWGPALAAPLAAWLVSQHGWRNMFLVLGLGGAVWVVPWLMLSRHDDQQRKEHQKSEAQDRAASGAVAIPFGSLLRTRAMWGTLIGTFCYNYFLFFSLTWMPAYFVESRHLSLDSMGIYTMFSFAGTAVMAIIAGSAADAMIRRGADPVNVRRWFSAAGLAAACTEVFGAMSSSAGVAVFFAIFSMTGLGLATANYWALTQSLFPGVGAGRVAGVQNTSLNLAGIVAPILTGWMKEATGNYAAPMLAIWVFLLIGVGAYLFLIREPVVFSAVAQSRARPEAIPL